MTVVVIIIVIVKMLELKGVERGAIVVHEPVGNPMSCKLSFQDLNNFGCGLVFKRVNFEVIRIVIHGAEIVFAMEMKDVRSNYFPGAAWDLVADEWFFRLLFLLKVAQTSHLAM